MSAQNPIFRFFERQLELLNDEREAEVAQNILLLSKCSLKLLEQKGLALLNLTPVNIQVGMGGRNLIELARSPAFAASQDAPLHPHTFRPGDLGRLEKSVPTKAVMAKKETRQRIREASLVEGVVYKVTDSRIILAVDPQGQHSSEDFELPSACNLIKLANNVTSDRMTKVMLSLQASLSHEKATDNRGVVIHPGAMSVANVLLGLSAPSTGANVDALEFYDTSLNESQKQAVRFAVGSKEVACIHGPPGTGKTHTLLEIIRQSLYPRFNHGSVNKGSAGKILVCGASNLSVDNILERLLLPPLPDMQPIKCTRVGHPARVRGQASLLDATLDAQSTRSEQATLVRDIKDELSESLLIAAGKAKGQKGKKPRGEERKKLWDEIKSLRQEFRKREKGIVGSVIADAEVVLATCHSAGGRALQNTSFDVVIIDEATQALEAACWIPTIKGKKLILAGDPLQLPPTVLAVTHTSNASKQTRSAKAKKSDPGIVTQASSKTDADDESSVESGAESSENEEPRTKSSAKALRPPKNLSVTLFERLEKMYGTSIKRMLEVQYRMNDKICEFPSKVLYGSRLRSDDSVVNHLLTDLQNVNKDASDLATPVVFLDTSGCEYFERTVEEGDEGSKYNENEAVLVKAWLEKLVAAGIYPSQIAIITPYQAQVTYISSLLSGTYGGELEIGTVDGMQGREKEAIIISLVRSNDKREVGFLKDKRRLNVAMTRARRHMCVVGDSSTVQHGSKFLKEWMSWLENSADVYYGGLEELP
ncbi:hypothetical protein ACEPAG_2119 [Sanghuangporus baumii]